MRPILLIIVVAAVLAANEKYGWPSSQYVVLPTYNEIDTAADKFLDIFGATTTTIHHDITINATTASTVVEPTKLASQTLNQSCGSLLIPVMEFERMSTPFSRVHTGVDLVAPLGSWIVAASSGVVKFAGWYSDYGRMIDIQHEDGVVTRYGHLSSFATSITPGKIVVRGQKIGKVGVSGHTTGPHVHFEVRINDDPIDPAPRLGISRCQK